MIQTKASAGSGQRGVTARCNRCRRKADPAVGVSRLGAGAYNRAARWRSAQICTACATEIVTDADTTAAHDNTRPPEKIEGYSVSSARSALQRLTRTQTTPEDPS